MIQQFKLIEKKNLTENVFEMVFEWEKHLDMLPGQFITFLLDKIWWRAYSILKIEWNKIILIIKKRELEEGWRWGSKIICELKIWEELKWVWPAWHFKLQDNKTNKLFIWTGTWLVPLHNMIIAELEKNNWNKVYLNFWVREESDIFYLNEFEELKNKYSNFDYEIHISRVKDLHSFKVQNPNHHIHSGYTTNYLTEENMKNYSEVYICWAPTMIEWVIEKLEKFDYTKNENIFYEKY